jgi:hypothetical protein
VHPEGYRPLWRGFCFLLSMAVDHVALMRRNLEWLRHNREEWKNGYEDAAKHGQHTLAELCGSQIALFEHMIARAEQFLKKHQ